MEIENDSVKNKIYCINFNDINYQAEISLAKAIMFKSLDVMDIYFIHYKYNDVFELINNLSEVLYVKIFMHCFSIRNYEKYFDLYLYNNRSYKFYEDFIIIDNFIMDLKNEFNKKDRNNATFFKYINSDIQVNEIDIDTQNFIINNKFGFLANTPQVIDVKLNNVLDELSNFNDYKYLNSIELYKECSISDVDIKGN